MNRIWSSTPATTNAPMPINTNTKRNDMTTWRMMSTVRFVTVVEVYVMLLLYVDIDWEKERYVTKLLVFVHTSSKYCTLYPLME